MPLLSNTYKKVTQVIYMECVYKYICRNGHTLVGGSILTIRL